MKKEREEVPCGTILLPRKCSCSRGSYDQPPMMLPDRDITPVRLWGMLMQFYLPDVLQELRDKAKTSKRNVAMRV